MLEAWGEIRMGLVWGSGKLSKGRGTRRLEERKGLDTRNLRESIYLLPGGG